MSATTGSIGLLIPVVLGFASGIHDRKTTFESNGRIVQMDEYRGREQRSRAPGVLVLHGTGGPKSRVPVRLARALAGKGYRVYVPHYLDATRGSAANPDDHYPTWVQVVEHARGSISRQAGEPVNGTALIGYSLGASIALATAAKDQQFSAVVALSGSLPDAYFRTMTTLPALLIIHGLQDRVIPAGNATQLASLCENRKLVCEVKVYREEGHSFSDHAMESVERDINTFLEHVLPANR